MKKIQRYLLLISCIKIVRSMNDSVNDYLNYKIILCYQRNVANFINPNTFVIQNIPRSFLRLVLSRVRRTIYNHIFHLWSKPGYEVTNSLRRRISLKNSLWYQRATAGRNFANLKTHKHASLFLSASVSRRNETHVRESTTTPSTIHNGGSIWLEGFCRDSRRNKERAAVSRGTSIFFDGYPVTRSRIPLPECFITRRALCPASGIDFSRFWLGLESPNNFLTFVR